jgi:hypothetical protein
MRDRITIILNILQFIVFMFLIYQAFVLNKLVHEADETLRTYDENQKQIKHHGDRLIRTHYTGIPDYSSDSDRIKVPNLSERKIKFYTLVDKRN